MTNYIKGIDISSIQGANLDFKAIKASGISFVIVRAYVGNNGLDSLYHSNIAAAQAAGLLVGSYNFIFPLPSNGIATRDPKVQAGLHYNTAKGTLAFIDCEWPVAADFYKWGCSVAQIQQWLTDYLEEYTRLDGGRKPIIYTYPNWAQTLQLGPYFAQYPLWIASYQSNPEVPQPWSDWVCWQASGGSEKLNNIPVDVDYVKDLSLWNVPTPTVQDTPAAVISNTQDNVSISTNSVIPLAPIKPVESSGVWSSIWNAVSSLFK